MSLFALLACQPAPVADDTASVTEDEVPAENPYGEVEGCPVFEDGTVSLEVDGETRDVEVVLPDDPEGAPLVFAWHWLGGTAQQTLSWMGLDGLADEGAIVLAPESTGIPSVEWDVISSAEQSVDIALFDALLSCAWEQFQVDTTRVHATGMSAGGLFTSFLSFHRADVLVSTLPFSGGVGAPYYATPAREIPMMLVWGGPSDTYGGYDFHSATMEMSERLQDDGHFVVECMHQLGHNPPEEAAEMAWSFFSAHTEVSGAPWESGLPDGLPSWCELP